MKNRGLIITNAFSYRESAKHQCESLIKEFALLGVDLVHKTNQELLVLINGNDVLSNIKPDDFDFVLYFDKDKYIALMLEKAGFKLFNCSQSIEICDDKMLTHIYLTNNGLKMPKTLSYPLCYEFNGCLDYVSEIEKELNYPFIVKENYGSLGNQVYLVNNKEELLELEEKLRYKPHLFQEYIKESFGVDYRLFLIGGNVVAAMKRINDKCFKANIAQGGRGELFIPDQKMIDLSVFASKILNLDYCAVDLVKNQKNEPLLIEVNSNAYFTEIEKITKVNIAKIYAQFIFNKIYIKQPR